MPRKEPLPKAGVLSFCFEICLTSGRLVVVIAYWTVTVPYSANDSLTARDDAIAKGCRDLATGLAEKGTRVSEDDLRHRALISDSWNTATGERRHEATEAYVHINWPADL